MKSVLMVLASTLLAACSSTGEYYAAKVQEAAHRAHAAQSYATAMVRIAETGGESAKVAAAMGLAMHQMQAAGRADTIQPVTSESLQWASILIPGANHAIGTWAGLRQATNASDNAVKSNAMMWGTVGSLGSWIAKDPVVVNHHTNTVEVVQPEIRIVEVPKLELVRPEIVLP